MLEHLTHTIVLLSAVASGSLVNAVFQGLCLAAAVALFLHFLSGIKPAARFLIWLSVLVTVLALHLESGLKGSPDSSLAPGVPLFHFDPRWGVPIASVWLALSLTRAVALVRSAFELRRIAKSATAISLDKQFQHLLTTRLRSAQLCTSAHVDRPSVVGFFHPRVLVPEDLLQKLSPQELEQIILHEMEHLRRFDDWTNLLQKIALAFFPLNPVLMWIERRLCRERELACDDCVLRVTLARKTYATCLTSLAEHSLVRRGVTLALGAWEKQSELSRRIHRILGKPDASMKPVTANVVAGIVVAGLLGGAFTLAHAPELVSFAPSAVQAIPSGLNMAAEIHSESALPIQHLSPELVKAVIPARQESTVSHGSATQRKPKAVKAIHHAPKPQLQQWMVLTRWQATPVRQHPKLTISETGESSYAALPVGNGWLIIQL